MPKRKTEGCGALANPPVSLASLDKALDLLACETFSHLDKLVKQFQICAGLQLNDGVAKQRWEEACTRHWVMKSMEDLCCSMTQSSKAAAAAATEEGEENMGSAGGINEAMGQDGRPMPRRPYFGAAMVHNFNDEEHREWRKWVPRAEDMVLVDLPDGQGIWPGKIIDKKSFYQGRTVPRGNHFWPVRIYSDDKEPVITVKSRMIPLHMRPDPPLLASPQLLSAYNHATEPLFFDCRATARELADAQRRSHPGVASSESSLLELRERKESWNKHVNWVMQERRAEKIRTLYDERQKRLMAHAKVDDGFTNPITESHTLDGFGQSEEDTKKRRTSTHGPGTTLEKLTSSNERGGIFKLSAPTAPNGTSAFTPYCSPNSKSLEVCPSSLFRPSILAGSVQRPASPRRPDLRRKSGIFSTVGEHVPRAGRGGTYTPPRILQSGDETLPGSSVDLDDQGRPRQSLSASPSPAPSLPTFDFISPLGPVKAGRLSAKLSAAGGVPPALNALGRSGSMSAACGLEAVKEEAGEDITGQEDGWTLVGQRKRAGSEGCLDQQSTGIQSQKDVLIDMEA